MLALISYQIKLSLIKFRKENSTPSQPSVHILSSELEGNAEELGVERTLDDPRRDELR